MWASNKTGGIVSQAGDRTSYSGPVAIGPLSINNKAGGIEFHKAGNA